MPALQIRLLGDFRLVYAGTLVTTVIQVRLQALVAYLLIHRHSPQLRKRIAFLFWPDSAEYQALTNLRQLLHHLSKTLPSFDKFLDVKTKSLQWRMEADYSLDVAEFESELVQASIAARENDASSERKALEIAVGHFQGELLLGCYDDWILPERERLSQAYAGALERLIILAEEQRDYASAIRHAELKLRHDPLHEITYRDLMRFHSIQGDRASALRVYQKCVATLKRELSIGPNEETREVYQRLFRLETTEGMNGLSTPISTALPTLVGRKNEWNTLRKIWNRATAGQASVVLLSGEAGIGKTRLAEKFLEWASLQGIITSRARSYAAEGMLAYAPVAKLLRTDPLRKRLSGIEDIWFTELARILPELLIERPGLPNPGQITESWQRKRLFETLAKVVLAEKDPLIILLDDLQWCDQDTLEWLHYLLHFNSKSKLLILGSMRPEEVDASHPLSPLLFDVRLNGQMTEIELGPLNPGDTTALAEQLIHKKLEPNQAMELFQYTEGNPLFVVETIWAKLNGEGDHGNELIGQVGNQQYFQTSKLPDKIQAVIQARLGQLSPTARELAGLAAAIGRTFTFEVLAQASEKDEEALAMALDELWRRRIVREQGHNVYDFSHDRIREVTYAGISPAQRKIYHKRVASTLERVYVANLDPVSGQIAAHLDEAGNVERAIDYYLRAVGVAQRTFSNSEAIDLVSRALAILPLLPETREREVQELNLLIGLGTSLMPVEGNGHPEVEKILLRAWDLCKMLGDHEKMIPVLVALWICNNLKGDLAQQAVWAENLAHEVQGSSNADLQIIASFALSGTVLFRGDFPGIRKYSEEGLAGWNAGEFNTQRFNFGIEPGIALIPGLAMSLWLLGYPDQARERFQYGYEEALKTSQPATIATVLGMGTIVYQWCGDASLTLDRSAAIIEYAREKEMPQWIAHGLMLHGWALGLTGDFDGGIAELREGLEEWQAMGAQLSMTYYPLLLAELLTLDGQYSEGLRVVEDAHKIVVEGGESWMEAELFRRKGELLLRQRTDLDEVETCFQQALEFARLQQARSFELRSATSLSQLWLRQGRRSEALYLLDQIFGWFTEGHDTADLRLAKNLLKRLA